MDNLYQEESSDQDKPLPHQSGKPGRKFFLSLAVIIVAGSVWFVGHGNTGFFTGGGDHVSSVERQARQHAFDTMKVFPLAEVREDEQNAALRSMNLSESERNALVARMTSGEHQPPSGDLKETNQASQLKNRSRHVAAPTTREASRSRDNRVRLAWLTLWDSDVEDGDVVRIDSEGYSRIVVLTKSPVTFAVPIPSTGTINVTGIRDGDGGGITAGIASGSSKVVLPVMSVGQVLGLKVAGD